MIVKTSFLGLVKEVKEEIKNERHFMCIVYSKIGKIHMFHHRHSCKCYNTMVGNDDQGLLK